MPIYEKGGSRRDGSTYSGDLSVDNDGNSIPDWQYSIRSGANVDVAGDDPEVGETLLIGAYMTSDRMEVQDSDGQGTHSKTYYIQRLYALWQWWQKVDTWWDRDLEDLVSLSMCMIRASYAYDSSTFAKTDSMLMWIRDWTPPVSNTWSGLNGLEAAGNEDIRWEQLMSDRSASGSVFNFYEAGSERFMTNFLNFIDDEGKDLGTMNVMAAELNDYPNSARAYACYFIASSGDTHETFKPKIWLRTVTKHKLNHCIGGSIQMTDGTAVLFNWQPTMNRYELRYQKINETSSTLVAWANIGDQIGLFSNAAGNQTVAMCRDDANNIYVCCSTGSTVYGDIKYFTIAAFKYMGGYDWDPAGSYNLGAASDHNGRVNNLAMVFLPETQGGPVGGTIAVLSSRRAGKWAQRQQVISTVNAAKLLNVPGAVINEQTTPHNPLTVPASNWRPMNQSATGMDMIQAGTGRKLAIGTYYPSNAVASEQFYACVVSTVAATGLAGAITRPTLGGDSKNTIEHDPNGKARTPWMPISGGMQRYAHICAGYMEIRNVVDDALFRSLDFTLFNITNFPSFDQMQGSSGWDIIWDSSVNRFWIYYVDSQNPRLVRKVAYDPELNVLYPSIQFTPAVLGPSGSRIVALRAPRGKIDSRCVLIDVAMIDGALAPLDLIVLRDLSMSHAPGAPIVNDVDAFNATAAKDVTWTFTDVDPGDYATSQDVEVRRVSNGTTVYTSGKKPAVLVSGTTYKYTLPAAALSNDTAYQVRVRSYDAVDGVGAWSDYKAFSTTGTGGMVTITTPEADNLPMNVSSVLVGWDYANINPAIVQTGYQAKVYNDATNVLEQDSGVVVSTGTTRTITGLASGIHHRIEISVRDSNLQMSGSGVVVVYPDYNNPSIPEIFVVPDPGTIAVRLTNPPPTGENPVTVSNQIRRKVTGADDSTYIIIGTAPVNGTFFDRSVASGTDYTYQARGVAANAATGPWSLAVNATARLQGMWFSIPGNDAFGTVQFPYGGVGRQETGDVARTTQDFIGREYPVIEYGTSKAQNLSITTQCDTNTQVNAARMFSTQPIVLLYRDGRGRKMYCTAGGLQMTDVERGWTDVQMTLTRVDYTEAIA